MSDFNVFLKKLKNNPNCKSSKPINYYFQRIKNEKIAFSLKPFNSNPQRLAAGLRINRKLPKTAIRP